MEERRGLTTIEANRRLETYGKNEIAKNGKPIALKVLISQFASPLIYVLVAAAVFSLINQKISDAIVISIAVLINTILGFVQEYRAERTLEALKEVLSPKAEVYRDGEKKIIPASEVVLGDIVFLSEDHKIAADGVILEEDGLFCVEAVLTGESEPVEKFDYPEEIAIEGVGFLNLRENFDQIENKFKVFMGTQVRAGLGRMMIIRTGEETMIGKVAEKIKVTHEEKTPLQKKVSILARQLTIMVVIAATIVVLFGLARGISFTEIFTTAVALAVSAIPEGLLIGLTVVLAVGMQRIFKYKAVVRKLVAAETLGSVDVICVDKTGTLTEGVMRVTHAEAEDVKKLAEAAVLCNVMRDPLEIGMMEWAKKVVAFHPENKPRLDLLPFDSRKKYQAVLSKCDGNERLYVTGAPEVLIKKSKISSGEQRNLIKRLSELGGKGYRLVGLAYREVSAGKMKIHDADISGLTWLGFLVYEDPIRRGVGEALERVSKAGISVKVITGDFRETAVAIMSALGLVIREDEVLTGEELNKLSDDELTDRVEKVRLFARTDPTQKLRIVDALKRKGHVVAMTGDGVNDALALRKADVGIVVNEATEVAKETSDMVLLDNNFSTIVRSVEEGRGIYDNLRKIIVYLLADTFDETLVVILSTLFFLPLPILPAQILWINLVSDGLPSLALAVEPKEEGVIFEKPRKRQIPLIDKEILIIIILISITATVTTLGAFLLFMKNGLGLAHARTVAFTMLGINSLFYVFSSRVLSKPIWKVNIFQNPWLLLAVGIGFLLQFSAIYFPPLQKLFSTVSLGFFELGVVFVGSIMMLLVIESVKLVRLMVK